MSAYDDLIQGETGLVLYGIVNDTTGTNSDELVANNDGTHAGTITVNSTGLLASESTKSVLYDGGSGRTSFPDSAALDFGDTFSIEGWFKMVALPGSGVNKTLAMKGDNSWMLACYNPSGTARWTLHVPNIGADIVYASSTPDTNTHHLVVTKTGSTRKFYVDGSDVTTLGTNQTCQNTSVAVFVASNQGVSEFSNVYVHKFALYNVLDHVGAGEFPLLCRPVGWVDEPWWSYQRWLVVRLRKGGRWGGWFEPESDECGYPGSMAIGGDESLRGIKAFTPDSPLGDCGELHHWAC